MNRTSLPFKPLRHRVRVVFLMLEQANTSGTCRDPDTLPQTLDRVVPNRPPEGITVEKVSPEALGLAVVLATDAEKVQPGLRGNLIFEAFREWTPAPTEANPSPQPRRTSFGFLPAIPFEVAGRATRK